jgi:TolA-binding protein
MSNINIKGVDELDTKIDELESKILRLVDLVRRVEEREKSMLNTLLDVVCRLRGVEEKLETDNKDEIHG